MTKRERKLQRAQLASGQVLAITRLRQYARPIIMKYSSMRSNCIGATRIVIETLKHFDVEAQPLVCKLRVRNAAHIECIDNYLKWNRDRGEAPRLIQESWRERGAWALYVGYERDDVDDLHAFIDQASGFDGHLIALVPSLMCAIDASIDQCDRPAKGIGPMPSVLTFPWNGRGSITGDDVDGRGTRCEYTALPHVRAFETAPDWLVDCAPCVGEIVAAMRGNHAHLP